MGITHYDKSFKEQAVKLSYERGSYSALARELGVSSSQLAKWRKEYAQYQTASFQGRGVERLTDEQRAYNELEKELKNSKLELEILKKSNSCLLKDRQVRYDDPKYSVESSKNGSPQSQSRPRDVLLHSDRGAQYASREFRALLRAQLFDYIEVWYNRSRRHSAIGYLTINEFWNQIIRNNKQIAA